MPKEACFLSFPSMFVEPVTVPGAGDKVLNKTGVTPTLPKLRGVETHVNQGMILLLQ